MKNLIINIYKTLFFFDLAIVVAYLLPDIKTGNAALLNLWREGISLAVMLIFTVFFARVVEQRRLRVCNFKNKLRHYCIGMLVGVIPIAVTVLPLWLFQSFRISGTNKPAGIVLWLASLLCNAAANELLLRGYLYRLYRKYYSLPVVTVVISLLFISLNINIFSHGAVYAVNMLLMNAVLCLVAEYSYSLLAPITAHFIYNVISGLLLGSFSVSPDYPAVFITEFSGKPLLSGGEMKLEGSIIMLAANLALFAFFAVRLYKRERGKMPVRRRKMPKR